ncbi:MAG TPA: hypothetical protein VGC61_02800 [Pyrinomonadaceae bacterium]|jgi:hypothetical protein
MVDNDREDAANDAEENEERDEQRAPAKKTPDTTSAPAAGDDIIIK